MLTKNVIEHYVLDCEAGGLRPDTVRDYRWALARLPTRLPCEPVVLSRIIGKSRLAPVSRRNMYVAWGTFFKWAQLHYEIPNPLDKVRKPRARMPLPRVFSQAEIRAIWSACRTQRDRAMIALLLDTGLRLGELSTLKWAGVGLGFARVDGKSGEHSVPLMPRVQELLVGLGDATRIFTGPRGPLTSWGVSEAILRIVNRAGIRGRRRLAHTFRHTFATEYIRAGGSVFALQQILGHREVGTTEIYVHLVRDDLAVRHEEYSAFRLVWEAPQAAAGEVEK
ncbi:MAG: site-specific integrase [Dehalococcoidia bacterium]